ncbi:unnamed protein product [Ectocarpus sp. CCAP 1310/34]|nr:unnamed protein product [Ectocarpus sp. CCAP 1310/34]
MGRQNVAAIGQVQQKSGSAQKQSSCVIANGVLWLNCERFWEKRGGFLNVVRRRCLSLS